MKSVSGPVRYRRYKGRTHAVVAIFFSFSPPCLPQAVTQERRRYGFILERQCSLAKHYLAYHSRGTSLLTHALDNWQDVAKTRESLPERLLAMLPSARPRVGAYECRVAVLDVIFALRCFGLQVVWICLLSAFGDTGIVHSVSFLSIVIFSVVNTFALLFPPFLWFLLFF